MTLQLGAPLENHLLVGSVILRYQSWWATSSKLRHLHHPRSNRFPLFVLAVSPVWFRFVDPFLGLSRIGSARHRQIALRAAGSLRAYSYM
jgi:hypothetical protein